MELDQPTLSTRKSCNRNEKVGFCLFPVLFLKSFLIYKIKTYYMLWGKNERIQVRALSKSSMNVYCGSLSLNWRRKWQPTPVFLLGKYHGRRSLVGYTVHGVAKSQTRLSDFTSLWLKKDDWKLMFGSNCTAANRPPPPAPRRKTRHVGWLFCTAQPAYPSQYDADVGNRFWMYKLSHNWWRQW